MLAREGPNLGLHYDQDGEENGKHVSDHLMKLTWTASEKRGEHGLVELCFVHPEHTNRPRCGLSKAVVQDACSFATIMRQRSEHIHSDI